MFCALLVAWAIVTCIPTLSSLCFVLELLKCLCMQCAVNVTPLSNLVFLLWGELDLLCDINVPWEREREMEMLLFLYGSVVICSTMKSCLSFKAVWLLRGGMMKTSICPFHYKNDLQCKIPIYSDRMCRFLRGSFVLESSSCACIQSFGWKICWLGLVAYM